MPVFDLASIVHMHITTLMKWIDIIPCQKALWVDITWIYSEASRPYSHPYSKQTTSHKSSGTYMYLLHA